MSKEEIYGLYVKTFIENRDVQRDFGKVACGWSAQHTLHAAEALARFDKPVLLLWGGDDKRLFPPELGRRLAAVFPHGRIKMIDNALALVQEDQPVQFCKHLMDFLLIDDRALTGRTAGAANRGIGRAFCNAPERSCAERALESVE